MSAAIVQSIRELTGRVLEHSSNLLGNYHPHDLHQFRVCTRRIRALLKRLKSRPAGFFLKSWADLFSVTSRARDLDVFLDSASQLLPTEQFRLFEPILVVFTETAQPWDTVHEELPNFPQMPDMVPGV